MMALSFSLCSSVDDANVDPEQHHLERNGPSIDDDARRSKQQTREELAKLLKGCCVRSASYERLILQIITACYCMAWTPGRTSRMILFDCSMCESLELSEKDFMRLGGFGQGPRSVLTPPKGAFSFAPSSVVVRKRERERDDDNGLASERGLCALLTTLSFTWSGQTRSNGDVCGLTGRNKKSKDPLFHQIMVYIPYA